MVRPVYVVHCVDTEGPLHESVEATFERLKAIFGIDLEPSVALLRHLQAGEVDLGGLEQAVRKVVDPHLLGYNDPLGALDGIGLAANNAYGATTVVNVDPATGAASRRVLNDPSAAVAAGHGS